MDYQELTDTFWENVDKLKQTQGLSWAYISKKTGHPAGSLSTAKYMKRTPSIGLALSLAKVLGTTVEELCGEESMAERSRTLRDVLYKATANLDESNILNLIFFAEDMAANQAKEPAKEEARSILAFDSKMGMTTLGGMIESLTEKYLGPKRAETDGENDRK